MSAILSKNLNTKGSGLTVGSPLDSGGIVINAKSGAAPIKLVDGTQQSATKLTADGTPGVAGNYLTGTAPVPNNAAITNIAITSNVITVTAVNNLQVGQNVEFNNVAVATFLNRTDAVVATRSASQFTAAYTHADYVSAADTGSAAQTYQSRAAGVSMYAGHE